MIFLHFFLLINENVELLEKKYSSWIICDSLELIQIWFVC
jgi:hypothetical protein